jgi:hypothetical protein
VTMVAYIHTHTVVYLDRAVGVLAPRLGEKDCAEPAFPEDSNQLIILYADILAIKPLQDIGFNS